MKNDQSVACEEKTGLHLCRFDQYSKKISKNTDAKAFVFLFDTRTSSHINAVKECGI